MAKSDLLKEAIADAKAVKETALANAKIALEEAFTPRIKSMLENELMSELEDEEMDMDVATDELEGGEDMEMDMEDDMAMDMPDSVGVGIDLDNDGSYDYEGDLGQGGMEDEMEDEMDMEMDVEDDMGAEDDLGAIDDMGAEEDDMGLEEIIAELEGDLYEAEEPVEEQVVDEAGDDGDGFFTESYESNSIDELIEAILAEEEEEEETKTEGMHGKDDKMKKEEADNKDKELKEAYDTVRHLKSVINEVNLLNAKLLYTNKLFRNFDLNEAQKMKVIENFDRAGNTREAKLVFTTLAESFKKPTTGKRKVVKESKSLASRPVATTAPSKETTQVLSEGFEQANRWKKLAGLI